MTDLRTTYLGLPLTSPLIASSSGLTNTLSDIKEMEKQGIGAVVLKSLFEEEIISELEKNMNQMHSENYLYPETLDYYSNEDTEDALTSYLKLITDCKRETSIPIIASINCVTQYNWPYFAKSIQDAGADALELNIFALPSNTENNGSENEQLNFNIIKNILSEVTIPVSIKISPYFSSLLNMIDNLSQTGIKGLVLFNRFYSPDIDIDNLEVIPSYVYSDPNECKLPIHWVGLAYNRVSCDLSASTGIHNVNAFIKLLLAGATTVQVASVLYKNGIPEIKKLNNGLSIWMKEKKYSSICEFRGMLSQSQAKNPAAYLRMQFMKHFAGK